MRIGIPVAAYHPGSTAEYVQRALSELGVEAVVLTKEGFVHAFQGELFDRYLCVDSGSPLSLLTPPFDARDLSNIGFWFIDYRHNKDRPERTPNDSENAQALLARGGVVFQAQYEDYEECLAYGDRVHWLPLGADPDVWRPYALQKEFHLGFVGSVWDPARGSILQSLLQVPGLKFACARPGQVWKEAASQLLSRCLAGFNVNSFFGEKVSFDVNMRVFETLSCGVPLITNGVPGLSRLFPVDAPFIRTYSSVEDLLPSVQDALSNQGFLNSGPEARSWIVAHGTYKERMKAILRSFSE